MFALEFPPLSHIVNWPGIAGEGAWWEINKVVLIYGIAALLTILLFVLGSRKKALVPTGAQNFFRAKRAITCAFLLFASRSRACEA